MITPTSRSTLCCLEGNKEERHETTINFSSTLSSSSLSSS